MDKNDYKELVVDLMRKDSIQHSKIEDLELKAEQQTQDYHFDMRNKEIELVMLKNRYDDLERENKDLRKQIKNHSCETPTDGCEVGSPKDYE